jgi:hypothetical protein
MVVVFWLVVVALGSHPTILVTSERNHGMLTVGDELIAVLLSCSWSANKSLDQMLVEPESCARVIGMEIQHLTHLTESSLRHIEYINRTESTTGRQAKAR